MNSRTCCPPRARVLWAELVADFQHRSGTLEPAGASRCAQVSWAAVPQPHRPQMPRRVSCDWAVIAW
ncbi:hypothetical protein [Saccharothrix algeriensis]|uniref:hypothetical protein n=1 Tax=Saccharothrix algeriensis TaxID=173560 RepID=UPI00195CCF29|nr:hypothetical protein [Saccharothrix algeriensis]